MINSEKILEEYKEKQAIYNSLEGMTCSLLSTLLSNKSLHIHSISSRTKSLQSLHGKVHRIGKNYNVIDDITDIVGIRITTYFSDELDKVSNLIASEFTIDNNNSIDKRKSLTPDRFGYMSLHLVASYKEDRTKLPEYKSFSEIKFEIQIRSILQHAWAEIEHDLGYKSSIEVPAALKRKFSRLSGLLELADEEFVSIKNSISNYLQDLPERLSQRPEDVTIDLNSLNAFITTTQKIIDIEQEMASVFKCPLTSTEDLMLSQSLNFLAMMDIITIDDLKQKYNEVSEFIIPFLTVWLTRQNYHKNNKDNTGTISQGISLLYLTYINLAMKNDSALTKTVLSSVPFMNVEKLCEEINTTWDIVRTEYNERLK